MVFEKEASSIVHVLVSLARVIWTWLCRTNVVSLIICARTSTGCHICSVSPLLNCSSPSVYLQSSLQTVVRITVIC